MRLSRPSCSLLLFAVVVGTIACRRTIEPMPLPPAPPGMNGGCNPELIDAVRHQDSSAIKQLRRRGAKGNCPELMKAFFEAIADDNVKPLPSLLEAGVDANGSYADACFPPLALAYQLRAFSYRDGTPIAERGTAVLAILIKNGADPNGSWAPGCSGVESNLWIGAGHITPIMIAAVAGDTAFVKLLMDGGANINARDTNGHDARYYAKESATPGGDEIVALLSR